MGTHDKPKRIGQIKGDSQNIMIRIGFMNDDLIRAPRPATTAPHVKSKSVSVKLKGLPQNDG